LKQLEFNKPNDLSRLHDELLTALPVLAPINGVPQMRVEGKDLLIRLFVPDEADESAIQVVVNQHVRVPPSAPPDFRQLWQNYAQAVQSASNLNQLKQALLQEGRLLFKELAISRVRDL